MTQLFLDTFTDADGTALTAHTPDTAPAGAYTVPGGAMAVQSNKAVGTAGFASHTADYGFSAAFEPTYPYTVSFTGRSFGLGDYTTGVILSGATDSLKVLLNDPTNLAVVTNNSEEFDAVVSNAEHTISVLVEADQFTVSIDGAAQTPVAFADGCRHFDTLTVTLEYPGSGTSYVDRVSVDDSETAPGPTYGVGLPSITAPDGTPVFLADGHGIDEDSLYAQVPMTTGHSRTRKRYTVTDRVVTVRWLLEPEQLTAVDDWYENTLLAGTRQFAARVRNQGAGPALLWWRARWIDYQTEMMHLGRGLVSGRLLLTGDGQVDGPETGALAMEVSVALLDIRSSVAVQAHLAMEILVALLQPTELAMEITVALLSTYFVEGARITEDDHARVTEDGDPRVIEDGTAPPAPPPPPVPTWNPSDKHANITLSNSDKTASKVSSPGEVSVRATVGIAATSKGYFEIRTDSVGNFQLVGVGDASATLNSFVGSDTHGWAYYQDTGGKYTNNSETAYGASWKTVGDIIGVAFDNGAIWFAKNGTWQNSGDPVAGTGAAFTGITGTIYPMLSVEAVSPQDVVTGRFVLADFTYTPPTGFPAWGN